MANLKQTEKDIYYFENVDFKEMMAYANNPNPVCGECLESLLFMDDCILIPILNEVYSKHCGMKVLERMKHYAEDDEIEKRRVEFWREWFEHKSPFAERK